MTSIHLPKKNWKEKALLSSVGGLVVSFFCSIILIAGLQLQIPFLKSIERVGADIGTRYMVAFHLDKRLMEGKIKYTFVDVDEDACNMFRKNISLCRTENPVPAELVADFVVAARKSGASVVIINVAPFENESDRNILRQALISNDDTWVIAPVYGRPAGENGTLIGNSRFDLTPTGAEGHLRLASFSATPDAEASDGLVRNFSSLTRLFIDKNYRDVPSAPYLASLLLDHKKALEADCIYFSLNCKESLPIKDKKASLSKAGFIFAIPYSLPSLSQNNEISYINAGYERLAASGLLNDGSGKFPISSQLLKGRVVVLGSSLPAAMDIHLTALGPMTGAEILINATRAFVEFGYTEKSLKPPQQISLFTKFKAKGESILIGFVIMIVAWFAIYFILERSKNKPCIKKILHYIAVVGLFLGGLGISVILELMVASGVLSNSVALGRQIDILTPILMLGLEGYVVGMTVFTKVIEDSLYCVFLFAKNILSKLG